MNELSPHSVTCVSDGCLASEVGAIDTDIYFAGGLYTPAKKPVVIM
ncbi:protein of unknown function [Streptantibioticus cattleyicolor NRRL 8057 = DSM 46488]|nr:protein of unknown function [Streptantibioticus cattleyicolor NRRL 8057 = DSM 46488]